MNKLTQGVLAKLEARSTQEQPLLEELRAKGGHALRDRAESFMLDVGPDVGLFLNILIRSMRAKTVLEVGGSVGYSTIWMAEAVRANAGRLYSIEINPRKQLEQRENLEQAELAKVVVFMNEELPIEISRIGDDIDFVLLDHWKELYIRDFDICWSKLRSGGIIIADNILRPKKNAQVIGAYLKHIRERTDARSMLLDVGDGIEITVKDSK